MSSRSKTIKVAKEALEKGKPLSTAELKEEVNTRTKYGVTSSELKSILNREDDFVCVGQDKLSRDTGCYKVDLWWLKELIPKPDEKTGRIKWTPEMKRVFIKLRIIDKLTQKQIAERMNLRLCQVKGVQKDLVNGKLRGFEKDVLKEQNKKERLEVNAG
jgi:hypothetical protein